MEYSHNSGVYYHEGKVYTSPAGLVSSWPKFDQDQRSTASTDGPIPQYPSTEVETFDSGSSFDNGFDYQPIHSGDRVAYAEYDSGTNSNVIILFDPSDGSLISKTNLVNTTSADETDGMQLTSIRGGDIFVMGDTFGKGVAGAVDKQGNALWYFNSSNFDNYGYATAPSEYLGNVLIASSTGSFSGPRLVELEGETGNVVNGIDLTNADDARTTEPTKPIVDKDRGLCFVYTEGGDYISAVDLDTFSETSRYASGGSGATEYHSDTFRLGPNGNIYTSHNQRTVRWDPVADSIDWTLSDSDFGTAPGHTQWLYYNSTDSLFGISEAGTAISLDAQNGSINYEVSTNFNVENFTDMIGIIDQDNGVAAYGPDFNDKIFAYDITDGSELWSYNYGPAWYSHLAHDSNDKTMIMWSNDIGNGNAGLVKIGIERPWPAFGQDLRWSNSTKSAVPQSTPSQVGSLDSGSAFGGGFTSQPMQSGYRIGAINGPSGSYVGNTITLYDPRDGSLVSNTNIPNNTSADYSDIWTLTSIKGKDVIAFGDSYGQGIAGAIDKDGNVLWYFNTSNFQNGAATTGVTDWNGNVLVAGVDDGGTYPRLVELDSSDGTVLNGVDLSNSDDIVGIQNIPVVDKSREVCFVYSQDGVSISEVDLNTFTENKNRSSGGNSYGSSFFLGPNGNIYTAHDDYTLAWDPETNTDLWEIPTSTFDTDPYTIHYVYYESNDTLFGASRNGTVVSLNASDGTKNFEVSTSFDAGGYYDMFGIIDQDNGVAIFGPDVNDTIFAYDVTDGSEIWSFTNSALSGSRAGRVSHDGTDNTILTAVSDIGNGNAGVLKIGVP